MLLKKRKAKLSKRGIYLQDKELIESEFKPGGHYVLDIKARRIIISPSENNEGNLVSKREVEGMTKPVIDIRRKEALQAFAGCDELQVEIYGERIYVTGYQKKKVFSQEQERNRSIIHLDKLNGLKKKARVSFSRSQLQMAVSLK